MSKILSVVILTHNQPHELARLLGNLRTVPKEVEIIVVDDHSDDESVADAVEAVKQFRNVTGAGSYEYLEQWAGCGGARNYGAKAAHGEWVWFVDGDDIIKPVALPRILRAISSVEKFVDMLLVDYEISHADGTVESTDFDGFRLRPWEVGIMAWFKVIRKSALTPFRERIMFEDNDWWMRQCFALRDLDSIPVVSGGPCYTYHQLAKGSATSVIEQLKVADGADPASVKSLDWFLSQRDPKLTEAIAWLFEDLAALLKVRVDAVKLRMPENYFDALDYMIKYFKRMLRVR